MFNPEKSHMPRTPAKSKAAFKPPEETEVLTPKAKAPKGAHRGANQDVDVTNNPHAMLRDEKVAALAGVGLSTLRQMRREGRAPRPDLDYPNRTRASRVWAWLDQQGAGVTP